MLIAKVASVATVPHCSRDAPIAAAFELYALTDSDGRATSADRLDLANVCARAVGERVELERRLAMGHRREQ